MSTALLFLAFLFGIALLELFLWIAACEVYRRMKKAKGINDG